MMGAHVGDHEKHANVEHLYMSYKQTNFIDRKRSKEMITPPHPRRGT